MRLACSSIETIDNPALSAWGGLPARLVVANPHQNKIALECVGRDGMLTLEVRSEITVSSFAVALRLFCHYRSLKVLNPANRKTGKRMNA